MTCFFDEKPDEITGIVTRPDEIWILGIDMTMREKMALAIYMRRHNGKPGIPWAELAPLFRNELMLDADACLAVLYDPTGAMIAAITPQRSTDGPENYQDMIAAAMEGA